MPDQIRDVFRTFAERRNADRNDVQAIEQILAEQTLGDQLPKIAIGRGDDPDIGADRCPAADGHIFPALQHAQKPRLRLKRHVADFVQKQSAAFGLFETARSRGLLHP